MTERRRRLYRGESGSEAREEIERRYELEGETPEQARESYGRIVGSVKREQVQNGTASDREWIRPHESTSRDGKRERVRGHYAHVHGHGIRHHAPPCGPDCRRGHREHAHRRGRR